MTQGVHADDLLVSRWVRIKKIGLYSIAFILALNVLWWVATESTQFDLAKLDPSDLSSLHIRSADGTGT